MEVVVGRKLGPHIEIIFSISQWLVIGIELILASIYSILYPIIKIHIDLRV